MPTLEIFSLFRALPEWESHLLTFQDYKINNVLPDIYGRDANLSLPDVLHIHLAQDQETVERWKHPRIICTPYKRTHRIDCPDKDYWLLYAHDRLESKYLLLTIMGPDAHNSPKWRSFLTTVYTDYVTPWINGSLACAKPEEF